MCKWVMLPDKNNPTEHRCPHPGNPYRPEHDVELHCHTWLDLRDAADLSHREAKARKAGKLLGFPHIRRKP